MRVRLLNNTSEWHAGSAACVQSLKHNVEAAGHEVVLTDRGDTAFYDCDAVMVNGEGTMHGDTPRSHRQLDVLARAQAEGRKTYLVNSCWFGMTSVKAREVLRRLDGACFREMTSAGAAGIPSAARLDSSADRDMIQDCEPTVDFGGAVVFGFKGRGAKFEWHCEPNQSLRAESWSQIIANLKTASMYVTGEHHGLYAAALARCPFVLRTANTPKMEALLAWSGSAIPVHGDDFEALLSTPQPASNYAEFFDWFDSQDVVRFNSDLSVKSC